MNLFERDFKQLTPKELAMVSKAEGLKKGPKLKLGKIKIYSQNELDEYHATLPLAFYSYDSLFPNNYLIPETAIRSLDGNTINKKFLNLLNSEISERDILRFINENRYYSLIGSIFQLGYLFGHHDTFLFKEFELSATYKADYLLIGKNSGGYNFIFIELENPSGRITTADGELGEVFRKVLSRSKSGTLG